MSLLAFFKITKRLYTGIQLQYACSYRFTKCYNQLKNVEQFLAKPDKIWNENIDALWGDPLAA
jgi:hypothetical protein